MQQDYDFSGKKVLITGAQRGIGYAVAEAFGEAGADINILAETADVADSAKRLTARLGREVNGIECDITDRNAVSRMVGGVGHLDVLINNAGVGWPTPVLDPAEKVDADFRRIVEVNIMGTFYVTRSAVPNMGRGGKIILTSSVMGRHALAGFAAYATTKHGVIGLTRALAMDLGPVGINVNAICPGGVGTETAIALGKDILQSINPNLDAESLSDEEAINIAASGNAIHEGMIEPDEIAKTFLFLASEAADDIHGQALNVDRGAFMA
jgi:NAD(P)-dependent dehydrogenase (short-subunit alcohol dehydrogenase family)